MRERHRTGMLIMGGAQNIDTVPLIRLELLRSGT